MFRIRRAVALPLLGPALLAVAPAPERPTVYLVGDSTMAERGDTTHTLERGWGQMFARFVDSTVTIRDVAANGRSTKSFRAEGRWNRVLASLHRGDYVLIEFGHNDEKTTDTTRFTDPQTDFRSNLERFVAEVRGKEATPVLLTPIVRRQFDGRGVLQDTHGAYADAVREVARDQRVALIDLQRLTEALVTKAGPEGSKALFVWVVPGASPIYPGGHRDDTHLNAAGALAVAQLAADAIRHTALPLAQHVVGTD